MRPQMDLFFIRGGRHEVEEEEARCLLSPLVLLVLFPLQVALLCGVLM